MFLKALSVVANVLTILGLPAILLLYARLVKAIREARTPRGVSEGCLEFLLPSPRMAINLVPLTGLALIPRPGDTVLLPGEGPEFGAGFYEVTHVCHSFTETERPAHPSEAQLIKVVAYVKKKSVGSEPL